MLKRKFHENAFCIADLVFKDAAKSPDHTKPLPESMLTNRQWRSDALQPVIFNYNRFSILECFFVLWSINQSNCAVIIFFIHQPVHYDIIKWKHFLHNWPFVRWIHQSPEYSLHKDQWYRTLMFSLICTQTNGWAKKSRCWWFEMPLKSLWCHCNVPM